ncbi:trans-ocimene synthase, chloroplastic [Musa acuminata AAA Group]|uniref:trans-ocimene synthase, chloroplastic n=1 Tax=Musa acuminata AAA Group TaxID=214697 RepID=UPI0031E2A09C
MLSSCSNLLQSPVSIGFIMNPPRLPLSSKLCRIMCLREEGARSPRNTLEGSRRSADYHPSIWDHHLIQSIESSYSDERFTADLDELKLEAKYLLESYKEPSAQLHLIGSMQRLGVAYHLGEEINESLGKIYTNGLWPNHDVHQTALGFRLLREHGHCVPSDVFEKYRDEKGFKKCLARDVRGLLSLYEASHFAIDGEEILDEANKFSAMHLKLLEKQVDPHVAEQVRHSLEIPLRWRMPRLETKYFIDVYDQQECRNPVLLKLAKLDFNIVQSIHREEMRELSKWWNELGLAQKLKFSRDRLLENYLWAVGIAHEPQFSKCRVGLTKLICILTVIDDVYDVYGLPEEVKLFTAAVKAWDLEAMDTLPDYLKCCYLALHNFVNETAADIEKDHGWDATALFRKEWESLCEAYLTEAEWFHKGYKPTLEEYLENSWISVGGPIAMSHAYCLSGNTLSDNSTSLLQQGGVQLIYWSSLIVRLSNDLGTSKAEMERGDTPKSVQCSINESGETERAAIERIRDMLSHSWKKLSEECWRTQLSRGFADMVLNMARTSQCIFQHGDGIGTSNGVTKNKITSLFVEHYSV